MYFWTLRGSTGQRTSSATIRRKSPRGLYDKVDLILWLVEPTTFIGGGERYIIEQLGKVKTPVILVINKTDTVKDEEILKAITTYKDVCEFAEIIPVSALKGQNTDDVTDSIFKYLPEGPMFFDEDTVTDQPERQSARS